MFSFPPTFILRHRRENLKKCTLRGLESRPDFKFITYPIVAPLPDLSNYLVLTLDAPPLTLADSNHGLFLIDGTWRYAAQMERELRKVAGPIATRSIPAYTTAYPRRQTDCPDPAQGLASIEALFIAYSILGRNTSNLLDNYHWKNLFLFQNQQISEDTFLN
jgi:pre-rRNA-processing protein TSR3